MNPSHPPIDWAALARQLGTLFDTGERGGAEEARAALTELLGGTQIEHAVEHCIRMEPGFELARSVLSLLRPAHAMHECHRIYREDPDSERRRSAVALLRVVATREALPWIEGFLSDPDEIIAAWGMGVLDRLVWSELLLEEDEPSVEALLARGDAHDAEAVRSCTHFIRSVIASRREEPPPAGSA